MRVSLERVRAVMRAPYAASWGSVSERELILVRLENGAGSVGWGEAAPLPGYEGATVDDVWSELARCQELLCDAAPDRRGELLGMISVAEARSAIDLAWRDLEGRRVGEPAWRLLGASSAPEVAVNHTIVAEHPEAARTEAARARAASFECVKVKVGTHDDTERVAAVRAAAGPEMAIRLDANGAWTVEQAVAALAELERFDIELCEEPVHGLAETARVAAKTRIPVSLDESAGLPGALDRRLCDAVCLKVSRCGGINGLVAASARARAAGYRVYVASTLDGPLGIAAALHAAAVVRPDLPCGLATLSLFQRPSPVTTTTGRMSPPPGPGLGYGLLEWYRTEIG